MNRRDTLAVLLALGAAAPLGLQAQPADRVIRVAYVATSATSAQIAHPGYRRFFAQPLAARGYVDGRNLVLDLRTAEGVTERIPEIVTDLVRLKTDVIVVGHVLIAQAAVKVTTTVPIFSMAGDPVSRGVAQSLNRPGGNVNGIMAAGIATVEQKRLQLLRELAPKARRVAFVATREWWDDWMAKAMQEAASQLGIQVVYVESKTTGFVDAFAAVRSEKPDAVFFEASPIAMNFRTEIGEFARASRIPSACGQQELVEAGCLMTYNFTNAESVRALADFVDRVVKGARPGDLPYLQYTKYEFAVNIKTANAIGLTIPQSVLLRADRVIE